MEQNITTYRHQSDNLTPKKLSYQPKILVLDDHKDILEIINVILADEGYDVTCVSTTKMFNERLLTEKPDLIILDYKLPDDNGGDICLRLKGDDLTSEIPVILFSAYFTKDADLSCFPCNAVITKPFDLEEFVETVNGVLTYNI